MRAEGPTSDMIERLPGSMRCIQPARFRRVVLLAFLFGLRNASISAVPNSDPEPSLVEFWQAGLASRPALDLQTVGTIELHGIQIQRLRYSGSSWNGEPERVYALYAHPAGPGPFPAVLQIHGGGQSCYPQNIAYFVEHGYACLAFDWTGRTKQRPDDTVTHWAQPIQGNMYGREGQDPREVVLFHAVLAAITGIDILAARPEVDANRIGIEGVSWGGFLTWVVNGLDSRVKAAVPVYGLGDLDLQWNDMGTALAAKTPRGRGLWRRLFDPASFTAMQHGEIFFVDGANDFFGPQDLAETRLAHLQVVHRRTYGPNRMHNIDEGSARAAVGWLDAHLKLGQPPFPAEPQLSFSTDERGAFRVLVTPDPKAPVESVRIDFARGAALPLLRCWLSVDAQKEGAASWAAVVPLIDSTDPVTVMAQVIDPDGRMYTSAVRTLRPAVDLPQRPRAHAEVSDVVSDWGGPLGGWYSRTGTDLFAADPPAGRLKSGQVDGRAAVYFESATKSTEVNFATRLTVDPGVAKGNGRDLEIWVHDARALRVRANFFLREPEAHEYELSVNAGAGWRRIVVRPSSFAPFLEESQKGRPPVIPPFASWNEVHEIDLFCDAVPGGKLAVGRLQWIDPADVK
jgi:cephalosporin-C deacetylase-like acetyl esterase